MTAARHLVIMAAGTGGHIMPGLAVAREMLARGWTISWLGTTEGMETRLVPQQGIELDTVGFNGLRGKGGLAQTIKGALQLLRAFAQSLAILRKRSATAVLGMGGYVCLPGGLMAALLRKPLMLVNADAALLLSNKALLPVADRVGFGLPGDAAAKTKHGVVTGNPVRAEIESLPVPAQRFAGREGPLRLLLVGGRLGAKVLNEMLPQAIAMLALEERPLVTHQTGRAHIDAVRAAYRAMGLLNHETEAEGAHIELVPFIDDMPRRLAECDVIVCRAGAVTVSELCAAGVASILVPLVISTTQHQRDNAQWLAREGAAIHLPQTELDPKRLADEIRALTRERLLSLAERARALAQPRAAQRVADEIEGMVAA